MSYRTKQLQRRRCRLPLLAPAGFASAADLPVKAKAKPVADVPFFFVIDDRVTYSWMPNGTDPGVFQQSSPDGGFNGKTAKQVYSFTHFDVWAYGTNFFTISMFKSDHNDPAAPCTGSPTSTVTVTGATRLRRRHRILRPVPLDVRLERNLQYQGLHHGAAA